MPEPGVDEPLVAEIADTLWRIEVNYNREGSGPGSRFEGQRCEVVQAAWVIRRMREETAAALKDAEDQIRRVAERLEAKGRAPGGDKLHLGTAAGVRLACVKLIEIRAGLFPGTGTPPAALSEMSTADLRAAFDGDDYPADRPAAAGRPRQEEDPRG